MRKAKTAAVVHAAELRRCDRNPVVVPEYEVVLAPSAGSPPDPPGSWKPYSAAYELEPGDVLTIEADTNVRAPAIQQVRVTVVEDQPTRITVEPIGTPISAS
jgi:hypothetical protein